MDRVSVSIGGAGAALVTGRLSATLRDTVLLAPFALKGMNRFKASEDWAKPDTA